MVWGISGPLFGLLVINTATTTITFLMVFVIQNTQNRDTAAMHIKLDELIRVSRRRATSCSISRSSTTGRWTYCAKIRKFAREAKSHTTARIRAEEVPEPDKPGKSKSAKKQGR